MEKGNNIENENYSVSAVIGGGVTSNPIENFNQQKRPKPVSAYQELSKILSALKKNQITIQEAMNLVQMRETPKPSRPYCKISDDGQIQILGIKGDNVINLYGDECEKLIKMVRTGYFDNYMKHNENRIRNSDLSNYTKSMFMEDAINNENMDK